MDGLGNLMRGTSLAVDENLEDVNNAEAMRPLEQGLSRLRVVKEYPPHTNLLANQTRRGFLILK